MTAPLLHAVMPGLLGTGPAWSIVNGDCRQVLAQMPAGSIQCVVTSPPYWSLRDYGVKPSVWGGDAMCVHDWADEVVQTKIGGGNWARAVNGRGEVQGKTEDFRATLTSESVQATCRICGAWSGYLGLEPTPELYVEHIVEVFRAVRRVLRDDGTLWLNMGDRYVLRPYSAGHAFDPRYGARNRAVLSGMCRPYKKPPAGLKNKDLVGIPWRVAFALQTDGWWLRQDIVWEKPCPMPESAKDRCTRAHEYVFLLTKRERYFYDAEAVKEPVTGNAHSRGAGVNKKAKIPAGWDTGKGSHRELRGRHKVKQNESFSAAVSGLVATRNLRDVWKIPPAPFPGPHFATFPPALAERCIRAGTSERGCCPRCGAPYRRLTRTVSSGESTSQHRVAGKFASLPLQFSHRRMNENTARSRRVNGADHDNPFAVKETTGWKATCGCAESLDAKTLPLAGLGNGPRDPVPCVVLDPFSGAGTTVMVALRLGRSGIGVELSKEYVEMSRQRIEEDIASRRKDGPTDTTEGRNGI